MTELIPTAIYMLPSIGPEINGIFSDSVERVFGFYIRTMVLFPLDILYFFSMIPQLHHMAMESLLSGMQILAF
jgi:hypothetical protein